MTEFCHEIPQRPAGGARPVRGASHKSESEREELTLLCGPSATSTRQSSLYHAPESISRRQLSALIVAQGVVISRYSRDQDGSDSSKKEVTLVCFLPGQGMMAAGGRSESAEDLSLNASRSAGDIANNATGSSATFAVSSLREVSAAVADVEEQLWTSKTTGNNSSTGSTSVTSSVAFAARLLSDKEKQNFDVVFTLSPSSASNKLSLSVWVNPDRFDAATEHFLLHQWHCVAKGVLSSEAFSGKFAEGSPPNPQEVDMGLPTLVQSLGWVDAESMKLWQKVESY